MKKVLTIAGSDSSGGAGIQADIKTMTANNVYAMSAITALTAQNTTGVTGILNISPDFIKSQLEMIFDDIFPDAIKIGMVSSPEIVEAIEYELVKYKAKNIVLDPVMVATSGSNLMENSAIKSIKEKLFPLASVITPNIPEAEVLSGISIKDEKDMLEAAKIIYENHHCAVLLKGGHSINDANDLLYENGKEMLVIGKGRALELAGFPLPFPDKEPSRTNNRAITYTRMMREKGEELAKESLNSKKDYDNHQPNEKE